MAAINPNKTWSELLIRGEPEQIDRFLRALEARFAEQGWTLEVKGGEKYGRYSQQRPVQYRWSAPPESRPRMYLTLDRTSERRLRGESFSLVDFMCRAPLEEEAAVFQSVMTTIIEPMAAEVGLPLTFPTFGPSSRGGTVPEHALRQLSDAADGQWPLPEAAEPAWRQFVITVCRNRNTIALGGIEQWLIANGWNEGEVPAMWKRLDGDLELLGDYREEVIASWP